MFQSSPGPWAECNVGGHTACDHGAACFNPHPARGPSATWRTPLPRLSISRVSILTRPVGRVQPELARQRYVLQSGFNPHPARGPSATNGFSWLARQNCMFQSSPGPWAECNPSSPHAVGLDFGVFQSSPGPWAECNVMRSPTASSMGWFQSSPGPWAECNAAISKEASAAATCFNPHPARGPSATPSHVITSISLTDAFQSSPGPWAECNGGPL